MPTGHSIQEASEDGESLLSLACSAGYYELAEVLLRMRASVEDRGIKGIERCVCVCVCVCMCPILLTLNVFVSLRKSLIKALHVGTHVHVRI